MTKSVVVIPARWESSRFPGKPLAKILGKAMILHVYEQASKALQIDQVFVATDHSKIKEVIEEFGGNAIMTSKDAASGSDRILEAISHPELIDADIIINVQGDEPLIPPLLIDKLVLSLEESREFQVVSAACPLSDHKLFANKNIVKAVMSDQQGMDENLHRALYFSRAAIPHDRDNKYTFAKSQIYWQHIGIYGYTRKALQSFSSLPQSHLETIESLEQLRFLDNGIGIGLLKTDYRGTGVDTPEDLIAVEKLLKK